MTIPIGRISTIYRYPVKSMAGQPDDATRLGWHGLDGDRRFAFRRLDDGGGFPWLIASRLPELILYRPFGRDTSSEEPLPTHVRTPEGEELELRGAALRDDVSRRYGHDVELMQLKHGIFDEAHVSVIDLATIAAVEREAGVALDPRRFRPNVVVETLDGEPFGEDGWVGGTLVFGSPESGAAVGVTMRDVRCMMINLDPDTARQDAAMMKTAVRLNQNTAGVYGMVVRAGDLAVGQEVWLRRE
jgi:MOSC domain-containing protein